MWMDLANVCTPVLVSDDVFMWPVIVVSLTHLNWKHHIHSVTICLKVKFIVETLKSEGHKQTTQLSLSLAHTHTPRVTKCQISFQQSGSQFKNSEADLTSTLWSMPKW